MCVCVNYRMEGKCGKISFVTVGDVRFLQGEKKTSTKTCPEVLVYETWYLTRTKSASVVCVSQMRQESLAKNKSADYAVKTDLKQNLRVAYYMYWH